MFFSKYVPRGGEIMIHPRNYISFESDDEHILNLQKEAYENEQLQFGVKTNEILNGFRFHYQGYFLNGERHGPGVDYTSFNFLSIEKYEGEFKNDKRNGRGKILKQGQTVLSEFKDNNFHGF